MRRRLRNPPQRHDDGPIAAFHEHALSRIAVPAAWIRQGVDERRRRGLGQRRDATAARRVVDDSVDPSMPCRRFELPRQNLIPQVFGHVRAMLDDPAIHVDQVQRAVRGVREKDRAEALVGRRQELRVLVGLARRQPRAVIADDNPAHEVAGGLDDEDVAVEIRRERVAAVDRRRGYGGIRRQRTVGAQHAVLIPTVHARSLARRPDGHDLVLRAAERFVASARPHQARVPQVVRRGHDVDVQHRLVRVPVDASRVVLRKAPLPARQRLADFERSVLQPQIRIGLRRVDPVVERPEQAVGVVLDVRIAPAEGVRHALFRVGAKIAVGVAREPEVRRLGDEDAVLEDLDRPRQHETVEEHRLLVHPPVVVRILEDTDAAGRLELARRRQILHVAEHLDHPHAPLRCPSR